MSERTITDGTGAPQPRCRHWWPISPSAVSTALLAAIAALLVVIAVQLPALTASSGGLLMSASNGAGTPVFLGTGPGSSLGTTQPTQGTTLAGPGNWHLRIAAGETWATASLTVHTPTVVSSQKEHVTVTTGGGATTTVTTTTVNTTGNVGADTVTVASQTVDTEKRTKAHGHITRTYTHTWATTATAFSNGTIVGTSRSSGMDTTVRTFNCSGTLVGISWGHKGNGSVNGTVPLLWVPQPPVQLPSVLGSGAGSVLTEQSADYDETVVLNGLATTTTITSQVGSVNSIWQQKVGVTAHGHTTTKLTTTTVNTTAVVAGVTVQSASSTTTRVTTVSTCTGTTEITITRWSSTATAFGNGTIVGTAASHGTNKNWSVFNGAGELIDSSWNHSGSGTKTGTVPVVPVWTPLSGGLIVGQVGPSQVF